MIEADGRQGKEGIMKKVDAEMDVEFRPEYDLGSLRVRKVGPKRKSCTSNSSDNRAVSLGKDETKKRKKTNLNRC